MCVCGAIIIVWLTDSNASLPTRLKKTTGLLLEVARKSKLLGPSGDSAAHAGTVGQVLSCPPLPRRAPFNTAAAQQQDCG